MIPNIAIMCVKFGDKYNDTHVINLLRMINENFKQPFDFFCFSDTEINRINTIQMQESLEHEGVWNKLRLFSLKQLESYDIKIYFDLDVVIHGSIDTVLNLNLDNLNVIRANWKPEWLLQDKQELNTLYNSSIMVWRDASQIHKKYLESPDIFMLKYKGIDRFFWHEKISINEIPPNIVYSYREGASPTDKTPFLFRPDYSVCIFNQHPKIETLHTDNPLYRIWSGSD
jgi:hypothetical protein